MVSKPSKRYTPPKRVAILTPEIPEDAPPALREGLARRTLVATTGRCPCGAELVLPSEITPGAVTVVAVEHEADCPANDEAIAHAVLGWKR
jgi:hypothetical protein